MNVAPLIASLAVIIATIVQSASARAADPPPIPVVHTLGDLRKIAPVRLPDGTDVRFGMTEPTENYPWRMLYCLVAADERLQARADMEDALGPLEFNWVDLDQGRFVDICGSEIVQNVKSPKGQEYFCTPLVLPRKGRYKVSIASPTRAGHPCALSKIEVTSMPAWPWMEFAETDSQAKDGLRLAAHPEAVAPAAAGVWAHWLDKAAPDDLQLDGDDNQHPLRVETQGDRLIVTVDPPISSSPIQLRGQMLARWWVNGKTVAATAGKPGMMRLRTEMPVRTVGKIVIALRSLPAALGPLKFGDRVGIQLLYSPNAMQTLDGSFARTGLPDTLLRRSNRVEFVVTAEMLQSPSTKPASP